MAQGSAEGIRTLGGSQGQQQEIDGTEQGWITSGQRLYSLHQVQEEKPAALVRCYGVKVWVGREGGSKGVRRCRV